MVYTLDIVRPQGGLCAVFSNPSSHLHDPEKQKMLMSRMGSMPSVILPDAEARSSPAIDAAADQYAFTKTTKRSITYRAEQGGGGNSASFHASP